MNDPTPSHLKHATLAQMHRWNLIYENAATPVDRQLELLTPGIKLKSGLGEGVGQDACRQRTAKLPKRWINAHFVHDTKLSGQADGSLELALRLTYLNQDMPPDGSVRQAELS